ncbi:hypothetical protein GCM10022215_19160 [Nocardioides fonticola]|uniref:HTH merR-type domain-containing protein n=1 Tax=Nocardioides fonticola TaxID=450363 RepID=A0ABP7XIK3_9ACTN
MDDEAGWTVGELAAMCGLSVRVLRHWDAVGVVTPERTEGGHRRYGPDQVTRLYQALALRRTGLGLQAIAGLLDDTGTDTGTDSGTITALRDHLDRVEADLRRQRRLRDRLAAALDHPAPDQLMRVIESMTMFEQYVHGYRADESARLDDQATALVDLLHRGIAYEPGERVLEVGCGVGAQTVALATNSPETAFVSIDISAESLARAAQRCADTGLDTVTFHQADVFTLPHDDGDLTESSFDHVFVCFVLEHLAEPAEALRRLLRLVRPGGTITVVEGDHGSTYFHPDDAAARAAIDCQVRLQRHAGGDALIGRRLYPLLTEAGWTGTRVEPRVVYVDGSRPDLAQSFILRTFTAMIAGVREPAVAAGLTDDVRFDAGLAALRRTAAPDGVFSYTFLAARARRPEAP